VELVSPDGAPVGVTTVAHAHTWPGLLHRAFSVVLLDDLGRLLLQQRAAVKSRFALRWANACCGHPLPGQDAAVAASARLQEELGLRLESLQSVGLYVYRASDPISGRVEHEYDHVLVSRVDASARFAPDPAEVADMRWVTSDELRDAMSTDPAGYAPWLPGVVCVWYEFQTRADAAERSVG
jgi:isopentenyl-diphosphate delta-isomerase